MFVAPVRDIPHRFALALHRLAPFGDGCHTVLVAGPEPLGHLHQLFRTTLSRSTQRFSHSATEIPASLRMARRRFGPMSPLWGFGIRTRRCSLTMHWCFPPEYGPRKPSWRRQRLNSVRVVGPKRGIRQLLEWSALCRRWREADGPF